MGENNSGPPQTHSPSSFCNVCSPTRPKDIAIVDVKKEIVIEFIRLTTV